MRSFRRDGSAAAKALAGMGLRIPTLTWNTNPVEGSGIRKFLTNNSAVHAVIFVLLVTCIPVWFSTVMIANFAGFSLGNCRSIACGQVFEPGMSSDGHAPRPAELLKKKIRATFQIDLCYYPAKLNGLVKWTSKRTRMPSTNCISCSRLPH